MSKETLQNLEQSSESPKFKYIEKEAVVDMKVSLAFRQRIVDISEYLIKNNVLKEDGSFSQEDVDNVNEQIKTQEFTQEWVKLYETTLIFIHEFEKLAEAAGFVKETDVLPEGLI